MAQKRMQQKLQNRTSFEVHTPVDGIIGPLSLFLRYICI